jgi:cyclic pyranopterin phosphate synthase
MPEEGVVPKSHKDIITYEQILEVAEVGVSLGISKIRLTGGEPLVRKDVLHLIEKLKKLPGLDELVLTTNGVLLEKMARPLKQTGLDRLNISLDTLDPEKYTRLTCGGDIRRVFKGIDAIIKEGFKNTKLNMVVMQGVNDDEVEHMISFCNKKGLRLQRINHYQLEDYGSIDQTYQAERPLKCKSCNRIRLTADGKLKPCLFSDLEIPLDFSNLKESLVQAIQGKPQAGTANVTSKNWQIGG